MEAGKLGSCAGHLWQARQAVVREGSTGSLMKEGKLGRKPGKLCHIMEGITAYYI